jgi:hypothetical protein
VEPTTWEPFVNFGSVQSDAPTLPMARWIRMPPLMRNKRRAYNFLGLMLIALLQLSVSANDGAHGHKSCYFPSGGLTGGAACFPDQENSRCCGYGWTCMSNGLCKVSQANLQNFKLQYYRGSCTDKTWDSPSCPHVCLDSRYSMFLTRLEG